MPRQGDNFVYQLVGHARERLDLERLQAVNFNEIRWDDPVPVDAGMEADMPRRGQIGVDVAVPQIRVENIVMQAAAAPAALVEHTDDDGYLLNLAGTRRERCLYCGQGELKVLEAGAAAVYGRIPGRDLYRCQNERCRETQYWAEHERVEREERARQDAARQEAYARRQLAEAPAMIFNYSFKPPAKFHGKSKDSLFYGIENELEAIPEIEPSTLAKNIYAAGSSLFYFKSDGSLKHGVEIITHPMSFDYFDKEYPSAVSEVMTEQAQNYWEDREYDMQTGRIARRDKTYQCGLHIHMSRDAFGPVGKNKNGDVVQTPYHLYKFLRFVYDNAPLVQFVAGRKGAVIHGAEMCSYDRNRLGTWEVKDWKTGQIVNSNEAYLLEASRRKTFPNDRYMAVNIQNKSTVELRVFRATTNQRRIRAYVQFCDAAFYYTKFTHLHNRNPLKQISEDGFRDYVKQNRDKYGDLQEVFEKSPLWDVNPEVAA